ncbi:MAG: hypothetical protein M5U26_02380 [Planctomycetota bacterium]|nr:hypothetical protein [Planctomycetota bacterium]
MRPNVRLASLLLIAACAWGLAVPASAGEAKGKGASHAKDKGGNKDKEKDKDNGQNDRAEGERGQGQGQSRGHDPDKDRGPDERPKGWDEGKKEGWRGENPPGWDHWDQGKRDGWKKDVTDARDEVGKECRKKGLADDERRQAEDAVERISIKGKPVKEARDKVIDAVRNGKKAKDVLNDEGITIEIGE